MVWGGLDVMHLQRLTDGCDHPEKFLAPVRQDQLGDPVYMKPGTAKHRGHLRRVLGLKWVEGDPPGAEADHSKNISVAIGSDSARGVQIYCDGSKRRKGDYGWVRGVYPA